MVPPLKPRMLHNPLETFDALAEKHAELSRYRKHELECDRLENALFFEHQLVGLELAALVIGLEREDLRAESDRATKRYLERLERREW